MAAGDSGRIARLLRLGADVWARDNLGFTALMCASFDGHISICALLLERLAQAGGDTRKYIETVIEEGIHKGWAAFTYAEYNHRKPAKFLKAAPLLAESMGNADFAKFLSGFRECMG